MPKEESLALDEMRRVVKGSVLWKEIIYRKQVESTNDVAKDLASRGAKDGTIVVAEEQTAGRGRLGRRWLAPPGTCVLCSLLFRPDLRPKQAHQMTMVCSMAAADAVERVTDLSVGLKWPNDLVIRSRTPDSRRPTWRKLAGVLTESGLVNTSLDFVIVGIGMNVNVSREILPGLAPNATSILAETGQEADRSTLLMHLLEGTEERYRRFEGEESPHREWAARLITLGRQVGVTTSEGVLNGVAEAVDETGALLLRTEDGSLHRLLAGDVTLNRT